MNKYCFICNKFRNTERHHITYFPERIINVCHSCHNNIHYTAEYSDLKPVKGEGTKFYLAKGKVILVNVSVMEKLKQIQIENGLKSYNEAVKWLLKKQEGEL